MTASESFGPGLRNQRERQGLTLEIIAKNTRISRHLLDSLERGDVTRWPRGIYRRAFVRAYAAAIGLPPEPTVCEFVRLFPEPGQDPPAVLDDDDPRRLRLTLAAEPSWRTPLLRSIAALLDTAVVLVVALVASKVPDVGFWIPAAIAGLAYHALAAILFGRSLGAWLVTSGVTAQQPRTIRDHFARLRQGWFPNLLDAERAPERHAAT
jgi:transcriptional regulator with XRE-family HTH domain